LATFPNRKRDVAYNILDEVASCLNNGASITDGGSLLRRRPASGKP